jgi:uncharacterized protein (DUF302 family)
MGDTLGGRTELDYTVNSKRDFQQTVEAVKQGTTEAGFRVLAVHDLAATLAEKGFPREPVTIVEVCRDRAARSRYPKRTQRMDIDAISIPL